MQNYQTVSENKVRFWYKAAPIEAFPENAGACVKYGTLQIAVFNFSRRKQWYACQNLCPHKLQMALSRGIIGEYEEEPKVACPFHKKTFSLLDGRNINGSECDIATYPVKIEQGYVYIGFNSKTMNP